MPTILSIRVDRGPGTDRVSVVGELDVAGRGELERVLAAARDTRRATDVDLTGLRLCDAGGARLLRDAAAAASAAGLGFAVMGIGGEVARVLALLRVALPGRATAAR